MLTERLQKERFKGTDFDDNAKTALENSLKEAKRFDHCYIGSEHLLLGLASPNLDESGKEAGEPIPARQVLNELGVTIDKVRSAVVFIIGVGDRNYPGEIRLTPRGNKIIELAAARAERSGKATVSDLDILDAIAEHGEGIAAGVLESLGVSMRRIREAVELFESVNQ